jgi:hypothetical protein
LIQQPDASPNPDTGHSALYSVSAHAGWSAEVTPVRCNDEKHASESERNACDDRSRCRHLECWYLSGYESETGKQDQQESDLGECDARMMAQGNRPNDRSHFERSDCSARPEARFWPQSRSEEDPG